MIRQQLQRPDQQIVEIQRVEGFHAVFVFRKDFQNLPVPVILVGFVKPFLRGHQLVLDVPDFALDLLQGQETVVYVEPLHDLLEHGGLVVVVIDHEGSAVSELFDIPAQDARAGGMEGADPGLFRLFPSDQGGNS